MTNKADSWFRKGNTRGRMELRLFCFPYAGGTSLVYRDWPELLPSGVEVISLELPGRGARLKNPPFVGMPALIDALAEQVLPLLDTPFCFFGHSMGALVAFELARCLRRRHALEPQLLFVSGRRAPQIPNTDPVTYNLPKDEFIQELQQLEGIPKEVLEHAELMEFVIPLLRADFRLTETYEYVPDLRLRCPILAYGGLQDKESTRDMLLLWQEQTSSAFGLHMLPGGHFFLRSSQTLLLELLAKELRKVIAGRRINSQRVSGASLV